MNPEVIYHEIAGGGDDQEGNRPDGIVVTLSYWTSDDFRTSNHYLLESKVMIDRKIIVDSMEVVRSFYMKHSKQIRQAIAVFDQLMEMNSEVSSNPLNQL